MDEWTDLRRLSADAKPRRRRAPAEREFHLYDSRPERTPEQWITLILSVVLHLLAILLVILLHREEVQEQEAAEAEKKPEQVQMVYLPPPPQSKPLPAPKPQPVPAPPTPIGKDKGTTPPVEPPPKEQSNQEAPEPVAASTGPQEGQPDASATPSTTSPFGRPAPATGAPNVFRGGDPYASAGTPSVGPRLGIGPRDNRTWKASAPDMAGRCVPEPIDPNDSTSKYGIVVGRVLRDGSGLPLGGAHLQIIGTEFATFTDQNGEYVLQFDRSLVDQCRSQFVRVSAPGYRSRLLTLALSQRARSDDVLLRR